MKLSIIALAFFAVAFAAPQGDKKPIEIISSNIETNADGSYSFAFESADGTKVSESGNQKQVGSKPEDIGTVSKGSYSYTSPDGVVITVNWVADENGFQATGDHLPTPPPMPEHVVKLLADLKAAGLL
ncbi:larval cuticle protein 1-like [Daphnia carinata]|uniref:larval cuticle protein 1-like n=1 Tax=Daphnia carinata TaxID=120202 RepID=UPI00257D4AE7|nr:larval cuticle protein 1-like [Daphnia carinata]